MGASANYCLDFPRNLAVEVHGLTGEQLVKASTEPSTMSVLGLVGQPTEDKRYRFQMCLAGLPAKRQLWTALRPGRRDAGRQGSGRPQGAGRDLRRPDSRPRSRLHLPTPEAGRRMVAALVLHPHGRGVSLSCVSAPQEAPEQARCSDLPQIASRLRQSDLPLTLKLQRPMCGIGSRRRRAQRSPPAGTQANLGRGRNAVDRNVRA
jgi:hypothetical protein